MTSRSLSVASHTTTSAGPVLAQATWWSGRLVTGKQREWMRKCPYARSFCTSVRCTSV
eukprot:CAMPEP_0181245526 /NCGR_PEP_ID=MMETSP1096-20121128/43474_1 /TAXON_ID=156174 ORGANISM="Chrysochromulina ericina, Strain CCMP281" /NCGR_SAMPLE_ID=MMETSP1096 /ASSEMBLY_ACC=CAM_ASM_000453 /LENGTH=57 /DNA_ID=CAMNT_0023342215 /DNA_START=68 /DNA_END=237 /DNA_ORIENTATION=+